MTYIALYRTQRKRKYLRKMRPHKKQLLKSRAIDCPNSEPLLQVLLAEEASLMQGDLSQYQVAMAKAVQICNEEGLVQYEGLAYERAGFLFAEREDYTKSQEYFNAARVLYAEKWGSCAKYEWLTEKSLALREPPDEKKMMWGKHIEVPAHAHTV